MERTLDYCETVKILYTKFCIQLSTYGLTAQLVSALAWRSKGPEFEPYSDLKIFFVPSDLCFYQVILIKELVLNMTFYNFLFFPYFIKVTATSHFSW